MKPEASPLDNPGSPLRQQRDSGCLHGREIDPGRVAQKEHGGSGRPRRGRWMRGGDIPQSACGMTGGYKRGEASGFIAHPPHDKHKTATASSPLRLMTNMKQRRLHHPSPHDKHETATASSLLRRMTKKNSDDFITPPSHDEETRRRCRRSRHTCPEARGCSRRWPALAPRRRRSR